MEALPLKGTWLNNLKTIFWGGFGGCLAFACLHFMTAADAQEQTLKVKELVIVDQAGQERIKLIEFWWKRGTFPQNDRQSKDQTNSTKHR